MNSLRYTFRSQSTTGVQQTIPQGPVAREGSNSAAVTLAASLDPTCYARVDLTEAGQSIYSISCKLIRIQPSPFTPPVLKLAANTNIFLFTTAIPVTIDSHNKYTNPFVWRTNANSAAERHLYVNIPVSSYAMNHFLGFQFILKPIDHWEVYIVAENPGSQPTESLVAYVHGIQDRRDRDFNMFTVEILERDTSRLPTSGRMVIIFVVYLLFLELV